MTLNLTCFSPDNFIQDPSPLSGQFLVVWHYAENGDNDIRGQLVAPDGSLAGGFLVVNDDPLHQLAPSVAVDSSGGYLVAYMCDEWPNEFATCVQPLVTDGSLVGGPTKLYSVALAAAPNEHSSLK